MHGMVAKNRDTKGYGSQRREFVAVLQSIWKFFWIRVFFFCIRGNLGMNRVVVLSVAPFRMCFFLYKR